MTRWLSIVLGAAAVTGAALMAAPTPAAAFGGWASPNYPFCAFFSGKDGGSGTDCSYFTIEQCRMTIFGVGGRCYENPLYAGPPDDYVPVRKRKRRAY